jgi:hypothetical protein
LASTHLRPTTREFFFQINLCSNSPYVTSSLTRRWVCLLWTCLVFRLVYIPWHWKFFFCTSNKPSFSTGFAGQTMSILLILYYNGSLVAWTVISLTMTKFKHLTFSMSGFTFSYTSNMFILMIPYDFCLLPENFAI